jgi:hypothetical protein
MQLQRFAISDINLDSYDAVVWLTSVVSNIFYLLVADSYCKLF